MFEFLSSVSSSILGFAAVAASSASFWFAVVLAVILLARIRIPGPILVAFVTYFEWLPFTFRGTATSDFFVSASFGRVCAGYCAVSFGLALLFELNSEIRALPTLRRFSGYLIGLGWLVASSRALCLAVNPDFSGNAEMKFGSRIAAAFATVLLVAEKIQSTCADDVERKPKNQVQREQSTTPVEGDTEELCVFSASSDSEHLHITVPSDAEQHVVISVNQEQDTAMTTEHVTSDLATPQVILDCLIQAAAKHEFGSEKVLDPKRVKYGPAVEGELGTGTFATVRSCRVDNKEHAAKIFRGEAVSEINSRAYAEAYSLRRFDHPHIVKLLYVTAHIETNRIALVMEKAACNFRCYLTHLENDASLGADEANRRRPRVSSFGRESQRSLRCEARKHSCVRR